MNRFRVLYHPTSASGAPVPNPGGREWSVELDAKSRGAAETEARKLISHPCVIVETQRLDDVTVIPPKRKRARRPKLEALGLMTGAAMLARASGRKS